jgi:catechol 2,3-dioxygenase-like lactoylglutathione lyase family enzyme
VLLLVREAFVTESAPAFGLNVVTFGVDDLGRSVRFYEALGLKRKMRAAGDEIAFFDAGGVVLALFRWHTLAADAALRELPRPQPFRGTSLASMCRSDADVDARMEHALGIGARLLKISHATPVGGYSGYFADPDGHPWEVVRAPGFSFTEDGRVMLLD